MAISFWLEKGGGTGPRLGRLATPHGTVETPVFMPVGTQGAVKACSPEDLLAHKVSMVLANTYHLYLRPGHETVERLGGLHAFMGWPGPILTDSGGYQVYSLAALRNVSDEGVLFRSHLDGSEHFLTPEKVVRVQRSLGVDIAMVLDECPPHESPPEIVRNAMDRSVRWARRCRDALEDDRTALFGIVQGGVRPDWRRECARELVRTGFSGYALGGLGLGEPREDLMACLQACAEALPEEAPRYLMGMGEPEDIVEAVRRGVDMFDCVLPTRSGRNGTLYTKRGKLRIKNSRYAQDGRPVEPGCGCYTCRKYSRAYLRHLFLARELLVYRLNTIHNLYYYQTLMESIRQAVQGEEFQGFADTFYRELANGDAEAEQGPEAEGASS